MNRDKLFTLSCVAVVLLFAALSLYRLDNCYFWQDEAYVAFMASHFVKTGHLSCWDGRNLYVALHGSLLRNDLTQPAQASLDIGAVIACFKLLGISTWTARLPSVVFAIGGLICFYALLRHEFPRKRTLIVFSLALLAFSVQYLLNARTCRYYAYAGFFSLLVFYFYRRFSSTRSWTYAIGASISAILLFYSHLLGGIAFLLSLLAAHIIFHRREFSAKDLVKIGWACVIFLAASLPFILANHLWSYGRGSNSPHGLADLRTHVWLAWLNVRDLNLSNCLPWSCAVGVIYLFAINRKDEDVASVMRPIREWEGIVLLYAIFLALLSAPSQVSMQVSTLRYLAPVLPFLCGICGAFLWMVSRVYRPAALGLFALIISTNILTLTPLPYDWIPCTDQPRSLLGAYIGEITHPYPTSDELVSKFLRQQAHRNDIVANFPSYHAITMDFYIGDFIQTGALLDDRCPVPKDIIQGLHAPLYINDTFPDWLVFYGLSANEGKRLVSTLQYYSRPHIVNGKKVSYSYSLVKKFDVNWIETNRSELLYHTFGPTKITNPNEAVYVYHVGKI